MKQGICGNRFGMTSLSGLINLVNSTALGVLFSSEFAFTTVSDDVFRLTMRRGRLHNTKLIVRARKHQILQVARFEKIAHQFHGNLRIRRQEQLVAHLVRCQAHPADPCPAGLGADAAHRTTGSSFL